MEYSGKQISWGNGRMVAVSYCAELGKFGLDFSVPVAEATKEGLTGEETLDEHRKGKVRLENGNIRTFMTLTAEAFCAMLQVANEVIDQTGIAQSSLTLSREEGRREGMERDMYKVALEQIAPKRQCCAIGCCHYMSGVAERALQDVAAIRSEAKGERSECVWTLQDDETGAWASTCGELWSFIDGGPQENRVRFCHGCGKPVKAQPVLDTE